jgi:alkanesulfonate monooxygenase SsuD/methylene tetrahydromethanopterin reductase-like flavin-dependent oxidoreductase (luciferase family)
MNANMVALAGRVADGMILQFSGPEQVARWVAIAHAERRLAGVDRPFEVMVNLWAYAGEDPAEGLAAFCHEVGPYLAVPTYRNAAIAISSADEVDAAATRWRTGGRDAAAAAVPRGVSDTLLCDLQRDDVAGRLAQFAAAGVDRVRFVPLTPVHGSPHHARAVVERLAGHRPGVL